MMRSKTGNLYRFLLIRTSLVLMTILMLNACSTIQYDGVQVNKEGRTVVSAIDAADNQKIENLYNAIMTLGPEYRAQ